MYEENTVMLQLKVLSHESYAHIVSDNQGQKSWDTHIILINVLLLQLWNGPPSPRSMLEWRERLFSSTTNIVQRGGGRGEFLRLSEHLIDELCIKNVNFWKCPLLSVNCCRDQCCKICLKHPLCSVFLVHSNNSRLPSIKVCRICNEYFSSYWTKTWLL